jgi:hypothetical protein
MRFVRAHQTSGAWLALAALLVQFVVSFAHIHRDDLIPIVAENALNASWPIPHSRKTRALRPQPEITIFARFVRA